MAGPIRKGIYCAQHPDARLLVVRTNKVAFGIVVRYRRCKACGKHITTEERIRPNRHAIIGKRAKMQSK